MVITNNPLIKSDLISILIPAAANQSKFAFPDQPQLRSTFLQSIFLPYIEFDFFGQQTLNRGLAGGFLVLYFEGRENIQQLPLVELLSDQRSSNRYNVNGILGFNSQEIVWPKSYFLTSAPIGGVSDFVITFGVNYSLTKI